MKLELFDSYNIRARLSPSIVLLGPMVITFFLCFKDLTTFVSSSLLICWLLAFTNYIPICRRHKKTNQNYAAIFLMPNDDTINAVSKQRYYSILSKIDSSFLVFEHPDNSDAFRTCCESAVEYLRVHTRENHLVQEANINYGFCKNLLRSKVIGIVLSLILCIVVAINALLKYDLWTEIPTVLYFAFLINFFMVVFWIFGVTKQKLENTAKIYAKTLLSAIDTIKM